MFGSRRPSNRLENPRVRTKPVDDNPPGSKSETVVQKTLGRGSELQTWGNTAVVIRSGANERSSAAEASASNKSALTDQDNRTPRKLVQQTVLVTETPKLLTPAVTTSPNARVPLSSRAGAATAVYHVGIG